MRRNVIRVSDGALIKHNDVLLRMLADNLTQAVDQAELVTQEERVTLTLTAVVLSVLAIISNSLLVYVVVRTTALHTSTNFFIASLSVAEFITGIFVIPFVGSSVTNGGWAFSSSLCCFTAAMGVLGPCAAAFSLVVVSADRCLATSKPLQYSSLVTKRNTVLVIVAVWFLSLMIALLPLTKWGVYSYSTKFRMCIMRNAPSSVDDDDDGDHGSQVLSKEILTTFLPAVVVVFLVLLTVKRIRGQRRIFAFVPVPVAATSLPPGTVAANKSNRTKAMRSLLLISAAFLLFCLPIAVAKVMCQRASKCFVSHTVLRTLVWLSFLCCVINPLIIMTLNRKFRATLRALFCCGKCSVLGTGVGDKEPFTITSGLQAILEATLVVNMIHGTGRPEDSRRRHAIQTQTARSVEMATPGFSRRGLVTLRKTRSSPDCHIAGIAEES